MSEASCAGLEKEFFPKFPFLSLSLFALLCLIGGGPTAQTHRHTMLLFPLFQSSRRRKKAQKARHSLFSKMSGVYFPPLRTTPRPSLPHPQFPAQLILASPVFFWLSHRRQDGSLPIKKYIGRRRRQKASAHDSFPHYFPRLKKRKETIFSGGRPRLLRRRRKTSKIITMGKARSSSSFVWRGRRRRGRRPPIYFLSSRAN